MDDKNLLKHDAAAAVVCFVVGGGDVRCPFMAMRVFVFRVSRSSSDLNYLIELSLLVTCACAMIFVSNVPSSDRFV
jgi:hypothetical protein